MSDTLVIQSHRSPLPAAWISRCIDSVKGWAIQESYDYRFLGDELFEALPDDIYQKTKDQPVVASDLARLICLKQALNEGYETVVWCDADFLIFEPLKFKLTREDYGLGRETWIQANQESGRAKAYVKVHNAFLFFRERNEFLDFYSDAAARLIREHEGTFAPQFAGPKMLTAIHNAVQCCVMESAGMLSPLVQKDLLTGGGQYLDLFRYSSKYMVYGVNLCSSLAQTGEISDREIDQVIDRLLSDPGILAVSRQNDPE